MFNDTLTGQTGGVEVINELRSLVLDLDEQVAKILVNIETIEQIHCKFTNVRQQIDFRADEGSTLCRSNATLVHILDDLLFYTLDDLNKNYQATSEVTERIVTHLEKYR